MKFRKKPVVIDALQWNNNLSEMVSFMGFALVNHDGLLEITTLEGQMIGNLGDWIIKGIKGEFYPIKKDIFEASYDEVTDDKPPIISKSRRIGPPLTPMPSEGEPLRKK